LPDHKGGISHTAREKEGLPLNRSRVVSIVVMVALAVVVMVLLGASLSSCCWGGKTVKETKTSPVNVETKSTGEQLMDLQKAHESGAISDKEYKKMRQDIIDKAEKK
jgi:hypothetical protein